MLCKTLLLSFERPRKVSSFRTLPSAVLTDEILVPTILVLSAVFTFASVLMLDAIRASSRPAECIDALDSDDMKNFLNNKKVWPACSFLKYLYAPLNCSRGTGLSTTRSWNILQKWAIFQYRRSWTLKDNIFEDDCMRAKRLFAIFYPSSCFFRKS